MNYTGIRVEIKTDFTVGNLIGVISPLTESLKEGDEYIFQFKIVNYTSTDILDYIGCADEDGVTHFITENISITGGKLVNTFQDEGVTKNEYLCHIKFKIPKTSKYRFVICRRAVDTDAPGKAFDIREVSCEKGSILPDYKENTNDLSDRVNQYQTHLEQTDYTISMLAKTESINHAESNMNSKIEATASHILLEVSKTESNMSSKIEATADSILLEVSKKTDSDSIISAINMSPEEIQISSEHIDMTGNLDLTGTFRCYKNGEDNSGPYLYQSGATHRGYLEGAKNPTFSSGIWTPDGVNETGYVAVGYTNSDAVDSNGCLFMSPEVGGGAYLYFNILSGGSNLYSGFRYTKDGKIYYNSFLTGKTTNNVYSHVFDGGISAYSLYCNALTASSIGCVGSGNFSGELTVNDYAYLNSNVRVNNQIYTLNNDLWLSSGGLNAQYMLNLNKGGYFRPKGSVQLGDSSNPFYQLVARYATSVVSDARKKTNIKYVASSTQPMTLDLSDAPEYDDSVTIDDMYEHIKELPIVTYDLKEDREKSKRQVGFLAQDIMDSPAGRYIVDDRDEDNLSYDTGNRISVLEGALKKAIEKIEILESIIYDIYKGGE